MRHLMIPLCAVESRPAIAVTHHPSRFVVLVFQYQMHLSLACKSVNPLRQVVETMARPAIFHVVGCIQPKPIAMELFDPIERIVNDELPYLLLTMTVEV